MAERLTKRAGYWHFQRRVPKDFSHLDKRGIVRHSTKVAVATDKRGKSQWTDASWSTVPI